MRGVYYEAWAPQKTPEKIRDEEAFLVRVKERMDDHPEIDARQACRAVFALLNERVAAGEVEDVINMMPREIQTLWPEPARQRAEAAQQA